MPLGPERYTRKSGCNFKHMLDVHKHIDRLLNIDTYLRERNPKMLIHDQQKSK